MARENDSDRWATVHQYEFDTDEKPSQAVILAVAESTNQSPLDLEPLSDTIDLEAIDALASSSEDDSTMMTLTFGYGDARVTVTPTSVEIEQ